MLICRNATYRNSFALQRGRQVTSRRLCSKIFTRCIFDSWQIPVYFSRNPTNRHHLHKKETTDMLDFASGSNVWDFFGHFLDRLLVVFPV